MKIITKRKFALFIDSFIFGSIIAVFQLFIPDLLLNKGIMVGFILIPFFVKDIVFKNASIGKKFLGICIYPFQDRPSPCLPRARRPRCRRLFHRTAKGRG